MSMDDAHLFDFNAGLLLDATRRRGLTSRNSAPS